MAFWPFISLMLISAIWAVYSVASSCQTDPKTLTSVCESFKPDVKLSVSGNKRSTLQHY